MAHCFFDDKVRSKDLKKMVEKREDNNRDIDLVEVCRFHFIYERINMRELYGEGYGDCRTCMCDPKNKQCRDTHLFVFISK